MSKISIIREELLKKIDLRESLDQVMPKTVDGSKLKQRWKTYLKENNNIGLITVNALINEIRNLNKYDSQLDILRINLLEMLSENSIVNKLIMVNEAVSGSRKNSFHSSFLSQSEKIIESENPVGEILGGKLESFKLIPGVSDIIKESYQSVDDGEIKEWKISHPFSYVSEKEDGLYFQVNGKVFCIKENSISFSNSPDDRFSYMTDVVQFPKKVISEDSISFHYDTQFGQYQIDETGQLYDRNMNKLDTSLFIENCQRILSENANTLKERMENKRNQSISDAIVSLSEGIKDSSIVVLDNIHLYENFRTGKKVIIGNIQEKYFVAQIAGSQVNNPSILQTYNPEKAITHFNKLSGVDISENYIDYLERHKARVDKINEDLESINKDMEKIKEMIKKTKEQKKRAENGSDQEKKFTQLIKDMEVKLAKLDKEKTKMKQEKEKENE